MTPPAGVTDPNLANNSATDTDTLTPQADLAITKSDGVTSVAPGQPTTYTIVVSNNGPSRRMVRFHRPGVANLSVTSVTCGSPSGGAACPTVPNTTVSADGSGNSGSLHRQPARREHDHLHRACDIGGERHRHAHQHGEQSPRRAA